MLKMFPLLTSLDRELGNMCSLLCSGLLCIIVRNYGNFVVLRLSFLLFGFCLNVLD